MKIKLRGNPKTGRIYINGILLKPDKSQGIVNHSPDGFSYGYMGSGPSQLALAMCIRFFGEDKAREVYMQFKHDVIAKLPQGKFEEEIDIESFEYYKNYSI